MLTYFLYFKPSVEYGYVGTIDEFPKLYVTGDTVENLSKKARKAIEIEAAFRQKRGTTMPTNYGLKKNSVAVEINFYNGIENE